MPPPSYIDGCHWWKGARRHSQDLYRWICSGWYQIDFVAKGGSLKEPYLWRARQARHCNLPLCRQRWSVWRKILPGIHLGPAMDVSRNYPLSNTLVASASKPRTHNFHAEATFWHQRVKPCACTRSCPSSHHQTGQSTHWLNCSSLFSKCLLLLVNEVGADQDRWLKRISTRSFCRATTGEHHFVVRWWAMG